QVEDRPKVDVKTLPALAGEDLDAAGKVMHRRVSERGVVRCRAGPDVARRARQSAAQHPRLELRGSGAARAVRGRVISLHARHGVELALVPVRADERGDGARLVEERAGVAQARLESDHIGYLEPTVA